MKSNGCSRQTAALLACVLTVAAYPTRLFSQTAAELESAPVQTTNAGTVVQPIILKFLDSATGQAVKPTAIQVNDKPADFTTEAGGLAVLELPEGKHILVIQTEGYLPLESAVTVAGGSNPVMTFEMDPAAPLDAEPVAADIAVLEGHVTDADTGALLEQVKVSLPDAGLTTTTDATGSYQFDLKVPAGSEAAQPAILLEARAEGYTPVRLKNVTLASGQRRRMPLVLEKVTSETLSIEMQEMDEASAAGSHRSFDWVFDATIR